MANKNPSDGVWGNFVKATDYHFMLRNLMLLSDNEKHDAAQKSLAFVGRTARCVDDNFICACVLEAAVETPRADKPPSGSSHKNDWQENSGSPGSCDSRWR